MNLNSTFNKHLNVYERGLVTLTNRIAIVLTLLLSSVAIPLMVISHLNLPVLLSSVAIYPLVVVLNYYKKYQLARHWLALCLYLLILALVIYRGSTSGVLYITAPALILILILFRGTTKALLSHIVLVAVVLISLLVYTRFYEPLNPYSNNTLKIVSPLFLAISLGFILTLARYFFRINQQYQQELIEVSDTKTRLIALIGHDLRTPINSLVSLLELAKNKSVSPEEFTMLVARLHQSTEEVHQTLNNLLNWAISQLGGLNSQPKKINVSNLCQSIIDLYRDVSFKKSIEIVKEIPANLNIWCDEEQAKLVVRNIYSNAVKYTPEGGRITIRAFSRDKNTEIEIFNTGSELTAGQLKKILEPGLKESQRGTQGEPGTGLGLMLTQEILALNNGKLKADSKPKQGTTFTIILPALA